MLSFLDAIFVPFSLFLTVGYHAYLWYCLKKKPSRTTRGINLQTIRRTWFLKIVEGGDKNDMLVVQSLRNSQMVAILNASFAILLNTALAALTNNSFKGSYLLNTPFLGSKSGKMFVQKYGLASFLFLFSFFCSSQALALFMDANFLINASSAEFSSSEYAEIALERGFLLVLIGNRLLLITFPFLLWIFGPLPVVLSSVALVWWLYELDFP
ncbi:hypothetical protein L484_013975 [Morus notabilis]|uniref:DUF599 domain-containing protein n=1 Tax=Morus notabilis TaxID=981085 RepID=W9R1S8_9ROSA|nr:uncharacterized protein LOC21397134 [Morus notabilis]EXB54249.1 hypothetical protein L484_013975 [Morus notabilis]